MPSKSTDFEELYRCLRLMQYRNLFATIREKPGSLSATEAFSAEIIFLLGEPTLGEFADFIGISQPNATYKINSLVSKGYITRESGESDRRECRLVVTKKFRDYYGNQIPDISRVTDGLTEDEKAVLNKLTGAIAEEILEGFTKQEFLRGEFDQMDIFEKCERRQPADEVRESGVYPYFHALESRQDVEVVMEGKRRIMLGSNNYLGLTINPNVIEAGIRAIEKYGTGCSGSRFLNGTLSMHLELEAELAEFLRKESVVTFSTGFQSNLGIISAIVGRTDFVICDKENHASIYDGCKLSYGKMLRFKHADMEDLERKLETVPDTAGILIVTDGVFSMGGDIAKLPEIVRLAKKYGARVMVDDAHGLGVIGEGGRGTANYYGLEKEVDIYMGTFSKSLASLGGYMAASERVADYVRHNSRPFIFSASMTPASCACALAALRELKTHPELVSSLAHNSKYVREGLTKRGIKHLDSETPIVPLYTYDMYRTLGIAKELYDEGVYVNPVLPPAAPPTDCLLRTSYMASHTEALLDEAMDIIGEVLNRKKWEMQL